MSKEKKIVGRVTIELEVDCPLCEMSFDVLEQDDEGDIVEKVCGNKWNDPIEVYCSHCNHDFTITELERY